MDGCKTLIKKGLVATGTLSLARRLLSPRVILLRYHSVQAAPDEGDCPIGRAIVHPADAFAAQMRWLARHYEPVTLDDLADGRPLPRRGVLITFDDGYADNFEVALPILDRVGLKAAFYITVGCVERQQLPWFCRLRRAFAATTRTEWQDEGTGRLWSLADEAERRQAFQSASGQCAARAGDAQDELLAAVERSLGVTPEPPAGRPMMSWEQIRELHARGHVVGSHTLTHPNMAQVSPDCLAHEMRESRRRLEEQLGAPVVHFSYPSPILQPHWNAATVACCRAAGYRSAVTCTPGPVLSSDSPLCLKRFPVPETMDAFRWTVQCAFLGRYA